jgi:transcriptional regulator with XRE-family HTH domain
MTEKSGNNPAMHFGKQMRKERLAHGWSLTEFAQRTGLNAGHLSRIENGKRPPTENVAAACDAVFPGRKGWFTEYYEELRGWSEVPAAFRSWAELEEKAAVLRVWKPGIMHGLLQTEDYARAMIDTVRGTSTETAAARLTNRMERQRRVLMRDDPPATWFIIDQLSLYRLVGSPEVMSTQMQHLADVAAMPNVTLQILPAVAHPANASEFIVTDDAAYAEHVVGGYVFTDEQTVSSLNRLFSTILSECYRASESLAMIAEVGEIWTGESPLTQKATGGPA